MKKKAVFAIVSAALLALGSSAFAQARDTINDVPDSGATVALLGMSLVGLLALRKKLA